MDIIGETYTLERPLIDWLTVTSYEENVRQTGKILLAAAANGQPIKDGVKRMQYLGQGAASPLGSLFYGEAIQRGSWHCMIQISGELCNEHEILTPIWAGVSEGWLKVTRLDLQMTVEKPESWEQWALFNRCQLRKIDTGWVESTDRDNHKHRTVYIGNRRNLRFARVYEKWAGGCLLRAEFETKQGRAEAMAKMLARGTESPGSLLKFLIQELGDDQLSALYLPHLEHSKIADRPKVARREPKTKKWLMETVLPSFTRYINEHGADPEVAYEFIKALVDADYWAQHNG